MIQISLIQKFKHDTVGKFQTLKELIELIDENNYQEEDIQEIIKEIKKTFNKMESAADSIIKKENLY